MLEYARWKYVIAILVLIASAIYSLPNLYPQDTAIQIAARRGSPLDTALIERVKGSLDAAKIVYKSAEIEGTSLLVRLADATTQAPAADQLRNELGSDYVVALNLASTVPDWLTAIGAKPMLLGLDLLGGIQFQMEVDRDAAIEGRASAYEQDIRAMFRNNRILRASVTRSGTHMTVQLNSPEDRNTLASLISREIPELMVEDGVGNTLKVTIRETEINAIVDGALEQNISTLRNRISELGVAEPVVARQGASRIVVELPGVQDAALARKILGATATLEYRGVVGDMGAAFEAQQTGRVPPEAELFLRKQVGSDGKPLPVLLSKRVIATGDQLVDAKSGYDEAGPQVSVKLNEIGGQRMLDFTTDNVGKEMAVVYIETTPEVRMVDGKEVRTNKTTKEVISVATLQGVFGKNFRTTGLESTQYASELALLLRAGALAAPVDIVEERIIGPSLGAENIEAGWKAVTFSFVFVLVFFLIYYKTFGIVTNIALLLNLLMLVAVMSMLGATLSLPGLAGIALTVGMSVDANVLINERIREELRAGNTPVSSIAVGYEKASGTIADANVTALLAGVALFLFGAGPVKGFAVSLVVGILTSMYTAVSVSRGVAALIYGGRRKVAKLSI